jgi:hypothetical protein
MAIFTRVNGDANGVVHVDTAENGGGIGGIVSTGIGKHPSMYKVATDGVSLQNQTGVGGAVEAVLRLIATQATVIAYQVEDDSSGEMRVLVEATGWDVSDLQNAVQNLGTVNGANFNGAGVYNVGFKS